jgi:hypothetical protein
MSEDDIERVRDIVYQRELEDAVVTCQDLLATLREELEAGRFSPADAEDEVYREHLISTLEQAELDPERWAVPREHLTPV